MNTSMPARVDFEGPLCQEAADEPVLAHEHLVRDLAALFLDRNLRFLARGEMLLDRAIGRCLRRLKREDALTELSYTRLGDYVQERGSFSLRKAQELIQIEEQLEKFPDLDKAFNEGRVSKSHVLVLLPHFDTLTVDEYSAWVERAAGLSVRRLRDAIAEHNLARAEEKSAGECGVPEGVEQARAEIDGAGDVTQGDKEADDDDKPTGVWVQCDVPPHVAQLWAVCKEAVSRMLGFEASDVMCLDYCMAEFLNGVGFRHRVDDATAEARRKWLEQWEQERKEEARRARERHAEVQRFLEDETSGWSFLDRTVPEVEITDAIQPPREGESAVEIDARLQMACRLRQRVRACLGRVLFTLSNRGLYKDMQFTSLGHYAVERLGMASRSAHKLVSMQRAFYHHPKVRAAYEDGRINQSQADLVMSVAGDFHEEAWLSYALRVSTLQLKRDVAAAKIYLAANPSEQNGLGNGGVPSLAPLDEILAEAREGESAGPHLDEVAQRARGGEVQGATPGSQAGDELQMSAQGPQAGDEVQMSAQGPQAGDEVQMSAQGPQAGDEVQMSAQGRHGGSEMYISTQGPQAGDELQMSAQGPRADDEVQMSAQRPQAGGELQMSGQGPQAGDEVHLSGQGPQAGDEVQMSAPNPQAGDEVQKSAPGLVAGDEAAQRGEAETRPRRPRRLVPVDDLLPVRWRVFVPEEIAGVWREVRDIGTRIVGRKATGAECLEAVCNAFLDTWSRELRQMVKTHPIHERQGWKCAVPTCSSRCLEDHHLEFRSRGGSNSRGNRAALCWKHHHRGVHAGRVRVTGKGPRALVVEQGLRPDGGAHLTFVGGQRVG